MYKPTPLPLPPVQGPIISRLGDVMSHVSMLSFRSSPRLALDAGVGARHLPRLLSGVCAPTYITVSRLTTAIENHLGIQLDPRQIFAENGEFLTRHVCDLIPNHQGCLPANALDEFGRRRFEFKDVNPGEWTSSRYPYGYLHAKEGQWN